jgi:hypothetical protein
MPKRIGMTLSICNYKKIVIVSFIKGTSTPTGLIIPVINNDLFLADPEIVQRGVLGGF